MHTSDLMMEAAPALKRPQKVVCYHCGKNCNNQRIAIEEKCFCCDGCKLVYELINDNGLCNYYELENHPGLQNIKPLRKDKFSFLDNDELARKHFSFTDGNHTVINFYIPGIHCSSCLWLLENLKKIDSGILESRVNFSLREVTIHFHRHSISVRKLAELLATIGYEPYISLEDSDGKKAVSPNRERNYKLGIAGFCFANIMMMSFPEYLGGEGFEAKYAIFLRYLNLLLALPVVLYCASEFFITAWKGLKIRTLNIDAPIAMAIAITFSRSIYEILSGTGSGYLDSMSGIVFFMLVGRTVQERTYRSLSFHRDYKSYFPIAVTVIEQGIETARSLHDLKKGDVVIINNDELIPADSILLEGNARVDYSFVTGESDPVRISDGERVYAGGRQQGEQIILKIVKPVAVSYLTSLWDNESFRKNQNDNEAMGIHKLSRHFTLILFSLAALVAIYWSLHDPSRVWNSVTGMLIVACPCALLLASTFTNGNLLRIFSKAGLFLKNAFVIEQLAVIQHIVFDKTGTITNGLEMNIEHGLQLNDHDRNVIHAITASSNHPYSIALHQLTAGATKEVEIRNWESYTGQGIQAIAGGEQVKIGNSIFTEIKECGANVYAQIGDRSYHFHTSPSLRNETASLIQNLGNYYHLSLLTGDNDNQRKAMESLFGKGANLYFQQKPIDKLNYISRTQKEGKKVMMIGDGLNDAGALAQSDIGITLTDDINNFTPACDAILDASKFNKLPAFIKMAKTGKGIITLSFIVSIIYNICGLWFAAQGLLNPMIAAILMPASTLSIVLLSTGFSSWTAYRLKLSTDTK